MNVSFFEGLRGYLGQEWVWGGRAGSLVSVFWRVFKKGVGMGMGMGMVH